MSESQGGSAQLRAVPAGSPAAAEAAPEDVPFNGLTPPQRKGGSRFISDVIVEMGFLPRERVDPVVEQAKTESRSPEQLLVESGMITGDQLSRAIAQRFGLHHVDLAVFKADVRAINLIPAQMARKLGAAPVGYDDKGHLLVAMSDPSNVLALDDLKLRTGGEVQPVVASPDDINGLISRMSRLDERLHRRSSRARKSSQTSRRFASPPRTRRSSSSSTRSSLRRSRRAPRTSTSSPRAARCACVSGSTACSARPRRSPSA